MLRRQHSAVWMTLALLSFLLPVSVAAQVAPGSDKESRLVREVIDTLQEEHFLQWQLDDELSARIFDRAFDSLDPQRVYFLASDVEDFASYRLRLDDQLRAGDISFARLLSERYLQRLDEATRVLDQQLGVDHDFTVDESVLRDRSDAPFVANAEARVELWRRRAKLLLLERMATGADLLAAREQLRKRYASLARRMHQTSDIELLENYLTTVTTTWDPHTTYMSPQTLEEFEIQMKLELDGIGAQLKWEDGYTVITAIVPGGAAARDGRLLPGDRILGVAQADEAEFTDVVDWPLRDVVAKVRGKRGTQVRIQVQHERGGIEVIDLTRAQIVLSDRHAHGEIFLQRSPETGKNLRLGVIDIPSFYRDLSPDRSRGFTSTTRDVRRIIQGFKSEKVDALVIDLRENGGGVLREALALTGLFLEQGPVVQVKGVGEDARQLPDPSDGKLWQGPLVVMTSQRSASASEIFAAAIQDYGRGLVIGDSHTFGKGSVQQLLEVGTEAEPMGALKLTTAKFYRPNGDSTQSVGVTADLILPALSSFLEIGERHIENAMEFSRVPAAAFETHGSLSQDLLRQLTRRSDARRGNDSGFQAIQDEIQSHLRVRGRTLTSLRKNDFMAEFAARKGERDLEEAAVDLTGEPKIERDFYLNEVMAITVDFVDLAN